jgi:predicted transcriptional regulator
MPRKRSKDQIVAQILVTCKDGANKTRVVYQANLNFRSVNSYLDLLQEKGLLETLPGPCVMYKTTPKGEKALESLAVIEEIYS